jgi:hypothetical protein
MGKINKKIIVSIIFVVAALATITGISLKDIYQSANTSSEQHNTTSIQTPITKQPSEIEKTCEQEQKQSISTVSHRIIDTKNTSNNELKKYHITKLIKKSSAHVDEVTKIVIGVEDIDVSSKASLLITFPDNSTKVEKVGAGKVFLFSKNSVEYLLIITNVKYYEYANSYIEIQIDEK